MNRVYLLLPPLCLPLLDPSSGFRELALLDALGSNKETKAREMEAFQLGLGGVLGTRLWEDCITSCGLKVEPQNGGMLHHLQ